MNTEKVFTAFNKDGEEILIYRKADNTYIDLNSEKKEIISKEEIDLETIMPANKSLNLKKHMLEASLKRKYRKDREKLIETKNIIFGIEKMVTNLKETKTESGYYFKEIPLYDYHYNWIGETNSLNIYTYLKTITIDDTYMYEVLKNLYDKEEYILFKSDKNNICRLPIFNNGMKYVEAQKIVTLHDIKKESIMTKKKVYEIANEVRKTKED